MQKKECQELESNCVTDHIMATNIDIAAKNGNILLAKISILKIGEPSKDLVYLLQKFGLFNLLGDPHRSRYRQSKGAESR